ncbi:MAG: RHS repeat-associated core domain-containing protein [Acidobacteriota bacterium]
MIGDRFDGLRTQHFFGFGEPTDLAASLGDSEHKRFTGHERDLGTIGGAGGVQAELDSMRARFCSPWTARFLSVDPARESVNLQRPQTWNRFSYAFNNPVTLVDPDGQVPILFKTAVKLAIKGGDIAATTAGIVEDAKTLASSDATSSERALAAASLLSEAVSPVSIRDAKLGVKATDAFGDAAGGADRIVDAVEASAGTVATRKSRVNKVKAVEGAGPHTGFKRDPATGKITGYTEFDAEGHAMRRFRGAGKPHGKVEVPLVIEQKPGRGQKSRAKRARPARPDEIPGGSQDGGG